MHYLIIFLVGMAIGGLLELLSMYVWELFAKKPLRMTHKFSLGKKISMFSLPIWGVIAVLATSSIAMLNFFLLAALIGTALEFLLGKGLKVLFGVKLWSYKHGQLGQFTSIYSFPYWGGAGLLFIALGKVVGL